MKTTLRSYHIIKGPLSWVAHGVREDSVRNRYQEISEAQFMSHGGSWCSIRPGAPQNKWNISEEYMVKQIQLQLNNLASHEINCDLVQTIIQSITGSWWQNNPHTSLAPSRCWPTGHGGVDFLLRNSPNVIQTPCHPISKCMEITHLWQSIKCFVK